MEASVTIEQSGDFRYLDTGGSGQPLVLLHGLFGALSNFTGIVDGLNDRYRVIVPMLPIYDLPLHNTGLGGLLTFVSNFVDHMDYNTFHLLGNSLGGHIAQLYTIAHPERVSSLCLTGSSGLFESGMGDGYPKRGDYGYIKKKTELTFYNSEIATKELVDEVFDTVNNREQALRIILTAKSALKHNLADQLNQIKCPVLLVWGEQDTITPPFVGERFHDLIKSSELHKMDKCGHAPMMEHPVDFNELLLAFLDRVDDNVPHGTESS